MAVNYKRYLAEHVLNEQEHVNYRALSRALKVHCNHAKRMLYDFHQSENAKTPHSVHATYTIIGVPDQTESAPANGTAANGDNEMMQSSPFVSSQPALQEEAAEAPPVTAVILAREEELADVKSRFKTVFSIFVYSVQSTSPQDLNVLADLGYTLLESQPEDPLEQGPQYGMIQNKNVKRRTRVGAPPAAPSPAAKPKPAEPASKSQFTKRKEPSPKEEEEEEKPATPVESTSRPRSQGSTKPAERPSQPKRDNSSIFKAFAKAKPKPKEETPAKTESPAESADVVMDDESGEEREDLFLDTGTRSSNKERESRKDREDRLRQMMEDEDMPDAPEESPAEKTPVEEPAPQEEEEPQEAPAPAPESTENTSGSRRRRGRRQVMKKHQTRDAEGYIVTREEPVWESFSEEEPEPPKPKRPAVSVAGKGGKGAGGGKPGQGSIMSFFGKK